MPIYLSSQFDLRTGLPIRKYMTVANTSQRDAIPSINRHEGFITYVADIEKNYQLQGGITNSDWVELLSSTISADWDDITNKPTTEAGYGIIDGFTSWDKDYNDLINTPTIITSHNDLTDLSTDDHTQYVLLAGRVGGQTINDNITTKDITAEQLVLTKSSAVARHTIFTYVT